MRTIKNVIKKTLFFFHIDLNTIVSIMRIFKKKVDVVYDVNSQPNLKCRCLLLYITQPFFSKQVSDRHQNQWQAREMARIIGSKGYIVDVVDFNNEKAQLKYMYDMIVGLIPRGIDIYSNNMNSGCIRIAYLTSMNLMVTSSNEEKRIEDLYKRRGVKLVPRRYAGMIQKEIENFDAVWYIGNSYNFHSYDCFKMPPVYYIKNNGYVFDWGNSSQKRDSKSFVFFGSLGQVHKGLDLLLEVFSTITTDCKLYVCAGYESEADFCRIYHKELYESSNIIPMGFVDINGSEFKKMALSCAYAILPSCAEGCAGSVLSVMSGGIIPIVSNVCGFDDDEAINMPDCSIETIASFVREYSKKDNEWIAENSRKAINIVKTKFSQECFVNSVNLAIEGVLNLKKAN